MLSSSTLAFTGCIYVPASRSEQHQVDIFTGNPHIAGSYPAIGDQRWWNGKEFQKTRGSMGDIFRYEQVPTPGAIVALQQDSNGSLTVEFRNDATVQRTFHFPPGPDCVVTPTRVIVRFKRDPSPGSEEITETAEVLLARNDRGQLAVVETITATMMTGIGIPIVPAKTRSIATYTFDPAP